MSADDKPQTEAEINAEIDKLAAEAANTGIDVKQRFKEEMQFKVVRDTWQAILHDGWTWGTCWSEPRMGKSTCLMKLSFTVYHDYDLVLNGIAFNVIGLIGKMDRNLPMRMWEIENRLHYRIPFMIYDDAGAGDNKASSQHLPYFDLIKGNWDTYATKIACIWNSLNQPDELTRQLCSKYTHELYVQSKGVAKYDKVRWGQNFYGWQGMQKKKWKQTFEFDRLPLDVYKQYDEMRMSLVDELNQKVHDRMAETEVGRLMKLVLPQDYDLLGLIHVKGALTEYDIKNLGIDREVLKRCKSRDLVFSEPDSTKHYKFDLSTLGLELLRQKNLLSMDPKELKRQIHANDPPN